MSQSAMAKDRQEVLRYLKANGDKRVHSRKAAGACHLSQPRFWAAVSTLLQKEKITEPGGKGSRVYDVVKSS